MSCITIERDQFQHQVDQKCNILVQTFIKHHIHHKYKKNKNRPHQPSKQTTQHKNKHLAINIPMRQLFSLIIFQKKMKRLKYMTNGGSTFCQNRVKCYISYSTVYLTTVVTFQNSDCTHETYNML